MDGAPPTNRRLRGYVFTPNLALIAGFAAVFVLMGMVVVVGLTTMAAINERLELIVHNHNVKRSLVNSMFLSARERVYGLQKMIVLNDPFERDAESMHLDSHAARFATSRQQLLAMDLSAEERDILDKQGELAAIAVPLQRKVAELIILDREEEASEYLLGNAIPTQEQILGLLGRLRDIQEDATRTASDEALKAHQQAQVVMGGLGSGAGILALVIASLTVRRAVRAEAALSREKERAEVTLHSIGDGVITVGTEERVEYLNPVAEQLTGWSAQEAVGRPVSEVFSVIDERTREPILAATGSTRPDGCGLGAVLVRSDGGEIAIEHTLSELPDAHGGSVIVFRDVSEMRALAEQLDHQARHDALTGLVNRRELERRLGQAVDGAHLDGAQHVLCYMDLDRFKVVNDTCGHQAGDELLRQLTRELKSHVRGSDVLARLGGDEFAVLLEGCPPQKAQQIAEAMRQAVHNFQFLWEEKGFTVGISIGLVPISADSGTLTDVLAAADAACYAAKDGGRNRVHLWSPADGYAAGTSANWSERLRRGLDEGLFRLAAQPLTALGADDGVLRSEVYLRLDEAGRELLPLTFLPAAERLKLMPEIDLWVLQRLIALLRNGEIADGLYSVNLSSQSICSETFTAQALAAVRQSGLPPGRICFEFTETTAIANLSQVRRFIEALRVAGCRFTLDDFGNGLSSFCYLKSLSIDSLKIGGSVVRTLMQDPVNAAMVESITRISHLLGIRTVAKSVEGQETLERLGTLGVDFAQGYGVSPPRPLPH